MDVLEIDWKKEIPLLNYLWDEVTWCSVHQWHHMTRWPTKFSTLERNWTDLPRKFVSLPGLFTRKCPWSSPPARIRRQAYGWGQPGFASGHPPGGRVAQGWGWELKHGGSERPLYRNGRQWHSGPAGEPRIRRRQYLAWPFAVKLNSENRNTQKTVWESILPAAANSSTRENAQESKALRHNSKTEALASGVWGVANRTFAAFRWWGTSWRHKRAKSFSTLSNLAEPALVSYKWNVKETSREVAHHLRVVNNSTPWIKNRDLFVYHLPRGRPPLSVKRMDNLPHERIARWGAGIARRHNAEPVGLVQVPVNRQNARRQKERKVELGLSGELGEEHCKRFRAAMTWSMPSSWWPMPGHEPNVG